jgi:hypothetical protein
LTIAAPAVLLPPSALAQAPEVDPAQSHDAADAHTLYLLPITDGQPSAERVAALLERLGRGGPYLRVGFSSVFRYMADVDAARDYEITTSRLEAIATAARATQAPFLVHLNGGRWAGGGPLVEQLAQDPNAMAWDQLDRPWSYLVDGEYHFSLSSYNETYRRYKERNLKAAAAWLKAFADGPDGHLLVGVSTDSEVLLGLQPYADYNPGALAEFVDWLSGDKRYGVGGRWETDGQRLSLRQVNERYGTHFVRWKDVRPPRENDGGPFWADWQTFRVLLVDHSVQEQVDWIIAAGLPGEQVFSHQSPALNPDVFGDTIATAEVAGGSLGITAYGPQALDGSLFAQVRVINRTWGIFEYNPLLPDSEADLAALDLLRGYSPRVVCPYHWDDLGGANEVGYTIVDTPLEAALRAFVTLYADQPLPG